MKSQSTNVLFLLSQNVQGVSLPLAPHCQDHPLCLNRQNLQQTKTKMKYAMQPRIRFTSLVFKQMMALNHAAILLLFKVLKYGQNVRINSIKRHRNIDAYCLKFWNLAKNLAKIYVRGIISKLHICVDNFFFHCSSEIIPLTFSQEFFSKL